MNTHTEFETEKKVYKAVENNTYTLSIRSVYLWEKYHILQWNN